MFLSFFLLNLKQAKYMKIYPDVCVCVCVHALVKTHYLTDVRGSQNTVA